MASSRLRRWIIRLRLRRIAPWWRRFRRNGYRPDRCEHCGHRFRWNRDARHSFGNDDNRRYHGPCIAYVTCRRRAEERLTVLGVVVELTGITSSDVREVMANRVDGPPWAGSDQWNLAWRVFYDLEQSTKQPEADRA